MSSLIKKYYSLTKPGVLYGNAITAAAGFLLASRGHIDFALFAALFVGTTLVIASACVLNNFLDQDIDKIMERTRQRAIVSGEVRGRNAVVFSIILGVIGMAVLLAWTNYLVVAIGTIGFIDYVVFYGMLSKRLSIHGTLVGSISGATPVLAGYAAVSGSIDVSAIIVFMTIFFWQMPEFFSISVYRHDEYKAAGVPVMSVVKGIASTKRQIFIYTVLFVVTSLLLTPFGHTGYVYLATMALIGLYWIRLGWQGFAAPDSNRWARRMFHFSLTVILVWSLMISIGPVLP